MNQTALPPALPTHKPRSCHVKFKAKEKIFFSKDFQYLFTKSNPLKADHCNTSYLKLFCFSKVEIKFSPNFSFKKVNEYQDVVAVRTIYRELGSPLKKN